MSEQTMRQRVIGALWGLDPISVENRVGPGTPDVNFIEGWMELKWLRRWPVTDSVVSVRHFTKQQRVWALRRWRRGGNVWIMLQVGHEWLLFDGCTGANVLGLAKRDDLVKFSRKHWRNGLIDSELRDVVNEKAGTSQ